MKKKKRAEGCMGDARWKGWGDEHQPNKWVLQRSKQQHGRPAAGERRDVAVGSIVHCALPALWGQTGAGPPPPAGRQAKNG